MPNDNRIDTWICTNISNRNLSINFLGIPVLRPGQQVDLLDDMTKEEVSQSNTLRSLVANGLITITKQTDGVTVSTITSSNVDAYDSVDHNHYLNEITPPTGSVNLNYKKIIRLGEPTSAYDATNKTYVDDLGNTKSDIGHQHDSTEITDFHDAVQANSLDEMAIPQDNVDFNNKRIVNLYLPVDGGDGVNKTYVDGLATGLKVVASSLVASTENIVNLDYRTTEVDGVTLTDGNRVLVKDQTDAKQNGIYVASTTGSWTRATDVDTDEEIANAYTLIEDGGLTNKNSAWVVQGSPTIGVDDIVWIMFTPPVAIDAGNGLQKVGNELSVVGTEDRIVVGPSGVDIASSYAGQSTITTLGNVSVGGWHATPIAVEHGGTGATTKNNASSNLGLIFSDITDVSSGQVLTASDRGKMFNTSATSGIITHTLPGATTAGNGFIISFRKSDATTNQVIVQRSGSDTINGSTTATLTYQNQTMTLVSDGSSSWIIAQRGQRNPTPIGEGGTGADLSATGGSGQYVKQSSTGANFTVGTISASDLPTGINASKLADGSVSDTELQYISTLSSNAQTQLNAKIEANNALLSIQNVKMVKKNPGTGEYSTIASAIAAINSAGDVSATNRYVIYIGPGVYSESLLTVPSYVYLVGKHIAATIIEPNASNHNVINLSSNSGLVNLTVQNAGSGYSGVYANDVGDFSLMHKCSISNCDIGVWQRSNAVDSFLYLEYIDFVDCSTNSIKVTNAATKESFLNCENLFIQYSSTNPSDAVLIDGEYCECNMTGAQFIGADTLGNAVRITNGGYLNFGGGRIEDWGKAFYVDSSGSNPYLKLQAVDLDDNTKDIIVDNSTCTGYYMGSITLSTMEIDPDAPFFLANNDSQIITVAKKGGNFTSVKDAVDSISDSSATKRYVVFVGPGTFSERTITMKQYVYIAGTTGKLATIIEQNAADTHLIETNVNCAIVNCFLRGVTGSGKATIRYTGNRFRLIDCRVGGGQTFVDAQNVTGASGNSLWITRCSLANGVSIVDFLKVSDDGANIVDVFIEGVVLLDGGGITNFATITGSYTKVHILNSLIRLADIDALGYGISISDGSDLRMLGCELGRYTTALLVPNSGAAPNIIVNSCIFRLDSVKDIDVAHLGATGAISATCVTSKVTINSSCSVGAQIFDSENGATTLVGDLYIGSTLSNAQNYTDALQKSQPVGVIYGGSLTATGLVVTASAGDGYLMTGTPPDDYAKYVEWAEGSTTVLANTDSYIYINSSGVVQNAASQPNIFQTIILGKVRSSASGIIFFQDIDVEADNCEIKLERTLRKGMGPIFPPTGCTVSENVTPFHLNVEGGYYYYGTHEYNPTGGTNITWTRWYRNGTGGWTTSSQSAVDNVYYDNNAVALASIPAGKFIKHSLYIVNDGTHESYHLVYAQAYYDSGLEAQNGPISTPPGTWSDNIVRIATIIVQEGATSIEDILDERARLGFTASASAVVTDHGGLTGLADDDHTAYLLVNGTRAMSGNLDLGTNDIENVGVINSIDIASHGTRHDPNGLDAVTTGTPSTLTASTINDEGLAGSLARSDHTHAITNASANTPSTIVSRDGSGNFSAGTITANLTGDVTGDVSGSSATFTGSLSGDVSGTQSATVVDSVGGSSAANINSAELLANAATNLNTVSTIVKRDGSGNFSAGTITATLNGNASNVSGTVAIANGGTGQTNASSALSALGGVPTSRTISTTAPLTGGGDLTTNRTIAIPAATSSVDGYMPQADKAKLDTYLGVKTVAQLGTATAGYTAWCSDALWSGGTGCWVFADGSNWRTTEAVVATTDPYIYDRDTSGFPISTDLFNSFSEDFVGPLAQSAYFLSATQNGGTVANVQVIDNAHPGITSLNTGTTNNNTGGALIYAGERSGTNALSWLLGGGRLYFGVIIYLPVLAATPSPDYIVRLGFRRNSNFADATNGVYFEYNRGTSVNWLIKTADNSNLTTVDTGIAVAATTWIKLECEINAAGTSASFYKDATLINVVGNPITTNIPTTSGREIQPMLEIRKTGSAVATSRSIYIDLFRTKQTLTVSR